MLIRQQFSRLTSPCLIIVFFLYPEYQATVKEDKHWFYIYSLSMLWNHITYWNRAIKEASTCHLLFARHGNAPCSVIDEVWGNPSTITSVIGSWYWDGGNTDAVKSLPLLLWILSSNYPDLTIHLWQRSHVTPKLWRSCQCGGGSRDRQRHMGSSGSASVNNERELVWYCVLICPIRPSNAALSLGTNSVNGKLHHKDKGVSENV